MLSREEFNELRALIIRRCRRGVREIRQLIRDAEYWNDCVRKDDEPVIDVGKTELLQIAEHYELVIEQTKAGDRLSSFVGIARLMGVDEEESE